MSMHHTPPVRPATHVEVRDHRGDKPVVVRGEHREARPVIRVERERPIAVRNVYIAPTYASWTPAPSYTVAPQPLELMAPTSLADNQLSVDVNLGGATALELDAAAGTTYVSQVVLVDAYGSAETIPVNQMLSAQNPTIQLPVSQGSSITRVILDGHSDWGGQLAMRAL